MMAILIGTLDRVLKCYKKSVEWWGRSNYRIIEIGKNIGHLKKLTGVTRFPVEIGGKDSQELKF